MDQESGGSAPAINNSPNDKTYNTKKQFLYNPKDSGPFHVYFENNSPDFKGKLNAVKVNDIIYAVHPEIDKKIKEIDSVGRNRIRVILKDSQSANILVSSDKFISHHLDCYIPKFLIVRQGVLSDIEPELTEEVIKNRIQKFDYHCNFEVSAVRRIQKTIIDKNTNEKTKVNTKSVIITFRAQSLPKYVALGHVKVNVTPYIQRVILCYNCFRYGHPSSQCKSKLRCLKCKGEHKTTDCIIETELICFHCNKNHATNELKKCSEFSRQKNIKEAMATNNITYKEAEKQFPKKSYASVLAQSQSDVNLNSLDDLLSFSSPPPNNTNNRSSKFTQIITPSKRQRPSSPNPILSQHNQILSQFNLSQNSGSLLSDPIYQNGISNTPRSLKSLPTTSNNINVSLMVEIIFSVLNILKQNNTFDINKSELTNIINLKCAENNQN